MMVVSDSFRNKHSFISTFIPKECETRREGIVKAQNSFQ